MEPGFYEIIFPQNNDYSCTFTFVDGDGVAINYSSAHVGSTVTWTAQFKEYYEQPSASAVSFTVVDSNSNVGQITISLPHSITAALPGDGFWDLEIDIGGSKATFLAGPVKIPRVVTHV